MKVKSEIISTFKGKLGNIEFDNEKILSTVEYIYNLYDEVYDFLDADYAISLLSDAVINYIDNIGSLEDYIEDMESHLKYYKENIDSSWADLIDSHFDFFIIDSYTKDFLLYLDTLNTK